MMTVFLLVLVLMLLGVGGMAIGVMFGRKPISGSCGGVGATGVSGGTCELCGGNPNACESEEDAPRASRSKRAGKDAFYDASR